jgi:hypothetical protein
MRAYARPMLIRRFDTEEERCDALIPVSLKSGVGGFLYDEAWMQRWIQRHPTLLPIDQIEPSLTPLTPVCMELPTPSGFVDNLMMTPDGGLVVVETKLWRNPQARREVVGQVLDYAKDLSRWDYEALERAVRIARREPGLNLYQLVCGGDAAAEREAPFIDAVTRNLRHGRLLLVIAGDGIQESAEQLTDYLQRHMALHFTLAIVELSLWRIPETAMVFIQPKIIARTVQIERAVVRLEEGVALQPAGITPASPSARPATLTSERYFEALRAVDPGLPDQLQAFLKEVEALGVHADIQRNLSLKWRTPEGREFNLGVIDLAGRYATDYAHSSANSIGRVDLSHAYQARLARAIPGLSARQTPTPIGWRLVEGDANASIATLLRHRDRWISALADYIRALQGAMLGDVSAGDQSAADAALLRDHLARFGDNNPVPDPPEWIEEVRRGQFHNIPEDLNWDNAVVFAHLINGYELTREMGADEADLINGVLRRAELGEPWPSRAPVLWAVLYFQYRRDRHSGGYGLEGKEKALMDDLCQVLRARLAALPPPSAEGVAAQG